MKNAILACHNPIQTHWQLGQTATGGSNLTLIGWQISPIPVDSGMPEAVAQILTRAMISATQVVFPSSDVKGDIPTDWETVGDDLVCALKEESLIKRALNSLSNAPSTIVLLSTRKPEVVIRLFDDAAYPWWMQGQIALLTAPERATPKINRQILLALFEGDWTRQALQLQSVGIQCVLRPGVDGSVAGFLFLTDAFRTTFLKALEEESHAAEFDWSLLSETGFASSLADNPR